MAISTATTMKIYLTQINIIPALPPHCLKIHYNTILPSMLWYSKWSLLLQVSLTKVSLFRLIHMYLIIFLIFLPIQIKKLLKQFSSATCYFLPCIIKWPSQFSDIFSLCSSLHMRVQATQQYETTGKMTVLCTLTFIFLDSRQEATRFWSEC